MIVFEKPMSRRRIGNILCRLSLGAIVSLIGITTGCGGGGDSTPTPSPSPSINPSPSPSVGVSPSPSPSVEPSPSPSPSTPPLPDYNVGANQGRFLFSGANNTNANLQEMFFSDPRPLVDFNTGNSSCLFGYNGYANSNIGISLRDSSKVRDVSIEIKYRESLVDLSGHSALVLPVEAAVMDGYPTGSQFATAQVSYYENDGSVSHQWKAVSGTVHVIGWESYSLHVRLENIRFEPYVPDSTTPSTDPATGSFLLNGEENIPTLKLII